MRTPARHLAFALTLCIGTRAARAQTGTVVGRVTGASTGVPVSGAQVTIGETRARALVGEDGRFRLVNVPAGSHTLQARAVGYAPMTRAFTLAPNDSAVVTLSLTPSSIQLDAVVVTGTAGDTRRRAVGNSVAIVNASEIVSWSAVANLAEVLQAKTPGLSVLQPSGTAGTAASFRLRGAGSLGAGNSPTIYVDGVRVSSRDQGNYDVFGQTTSALDAINPADIESVEVIKGPSASTLYGAEAASGVVQILTKKGQPGALRWNLRLEAGRSDWDSALRPINYATATADRLADPVNWPGFVGRSLGDVLAVHLMDDGRALRSAAISRLYLSASGGADRYTYFVSAGRASDEGVLFNNFSTLRSVRGAFGFTPTNTLTFSTNVALSGNRVRLPLSDDAGPLGLVSSAYLAVPGRRYDFPGGENYSTIVPEVANLYDNQTRASRYTVGASATYAPFTWLRNTVRAGLDANVGRAELYFAPDPLNLRPFLARGSLGIDNARGFIAEGRPITEDVTLNYDGTATRSVSQRLASITSIGVQYLANHFERTDAYGADVGSAELRSVASAATTSSSALESEQKSLGFYAQQQAALDDRLFVTVALRMDNNSAFAATLQHEFYPKASVSYVISEEPWFKVSGVSALRLRAAWGQAGNSPGPFDALRSYTSSIVTYANGSASALRYSSAGNPGLRPERGSEIELGFESAFLADRVNLDVSYYHKTTRDALIGVPVAPSTGF
ncbi:MAG: TonB-dependent receptor domain-containing protein, partial [Gemmatimonadaceae bacterium]